MRFIVCDTYEEAMHEAAQLVADLVRKKPDCILGLATGSTPIGLYDNLVKEYEAGRLDFSRVSSFNLDEYYPIAPENPQSYRYFMNTHLFDRINMDRNNTHVPNGNTANPLKECRDYEAMIDASAGVDLQILGIGQNGHIGFNEPAANLNSATHLTDLTSGTIAANARFFQKTGDVPCQALTMGMGTILKARKIVLLATGAAKHEALMALMSENITTEYPATLLKTHGDVTVICDRAACDRLYLGVDIGGTAIKSGIVNDRNELIAQTTVPTDASSEQNLLRQLEALCRDWMNRYPVQGIGVGTPGVVNSRTGRVEFAANLPYRNTDLQGFLEQALQLPVRIGNDANCAVLGEYYAGAGAGSRNMIMVTVGTGIGAGIIINGQLYSGSRGDGGEVGHTITHVGGRDCPCGQKGCLERYASASALAAAAQEAAAEHPDSLLAAKIAANQSDLRGLFDAKNAGCPIAAQVIDGWMEELAAGLISLNQIFAPDLIVLTGGVTNQGEAFFDLLKEKCGGKFPVLASQLQNTAGLIGAAMLQYKN